MNPEKINYAPGSTEPVLQDLERNQVNWNDFTAKASERPQMEKNERNRLERELSALGKLMEGSNVWWQLDGSINISLQQKEKGGDYIGIHSDVDISIMRNQLPQLEPYLKENNYALFLRSKNGTMRRFRRVGNAVFEGGYSNGVWEAPYIAAINELGEIRTTADIVRMQISIVDTDELGNPSERGIKYPKEWLEGKSIVFHDTTLQLSHPARYILFKVWFMREYDDSDITLFKNLDILTEKELDAVEQLVLETAKKQEWRINNTTFTAEIPFLQKRFDYLRDKKLFRQQEESR